MSDEKLEIKWTSEKVIDSLEKWHEANNYAFFKELRIGTGFNNTKSKDSEQRFDAYAIHYLKGQRNATTCYEIKVSRSDFMSEMKKPKKRRAGLRLSNHFYFVVPKGMLKIEEVPVECGLIFVDEIGNLDIIIEAPYRESMPTWQFVAVISKRLDAARRMEWEFEEKIRGVLYERESITRSALERHLSKWQNHNIGSREIPDKILDALEDLKTDVEAALLENRRV